MSDPSGTQAQGIGEGAAGALALPNFDEPATIRNAPGTLAELAWQARAVAKAITLPQALQDKPGDVLAIMLAGRELGIGPMASTRLVHIIQGQTSIATELKLALALRDGHTIEPLAEGAGWCVVGCREHPEARPVAWAMTPEHAAMASSADVGVDDSQVTIASEIRQGSKLLVEKDVWRSYQRDMLFWRAAGQFMRRHCPALAGGIRTVEELGEGVAE